MTHSNPNPSPSSPGARPTGASSAALRQIVFVVVGLACLTPWASPPIALAAGCVLGLLGLSAFGKQAKPFSRQIIQWCVATLGLLVPLQHLWAMVRDGMAFAFGTIVVTFVAGLLVGRWLRVGRDQTILVSSGTAICGGSAIAAVGSAIGATGGTMAIATGAVFLLNAAALYLFPILGHALHLSDAQFGTWAGVAIHDVSSVTGAATPYVAAGGTPGVAGDTATVVKLSRVVWIVPIALGAGWWVRRASAKAGAGATAKLPVPWLVILFLAASAASTFLPVVRDHAKEIRRVAGWGFQGALFLIGSGITRAALAAVGWRVLVLAVMLWIVVAAGSLPIILATVR